MRITVFLLQQFRRGGALLAVIYGQEDEGENEQTNDGGEFPPCQQRHLVAVHADQLVGAEIGQRDGPGHKIPAQPAAREEVVVTSRLGTSHLAPAMQPRRQRDGGADGEENAQLYGIKHPGSLFPSLFDACTRVGKHGATG